MFHVAELIFMCIVLYLRPTCILWSNYPFSEYIQHLSLSVICCSLSFLCFSEFVNDELTIKSVAVSTFHYFLL